MSKDKAPEKADTTISQPAQKAEPGRFSLWPQSLLIFAVFFALDVLTKLWAINALAPQIEGFPGRTIQVIPGLLNLQWATNTGAAFSLFSDHTGWLAVVSLIMSIIIFAYWYFLPKNEVWGRFALALILSGAIGNFIDRAFRGYVVDFIDVFVGQYHWPTFNIADSSICVGVGILIVRIWQGKI